MATIEFDILEFMSGLTGFTFSKAVLKRIALKRGVAEVTDYSQLTRRDEALLTADLLLTAYFSPNVWASYDESHGNFSKKVGSQTIYNKDALLDYIQDIYDEYEDETQVPNAAQVFFRNDI